MRRTTYSENRNIRKTDYDHFTIYIHCGAKKLAPFYFCYNL